MLRLFVRGLTPDKRDDDTSRAALVTLSAARDRSEAQALLNLLPETVTNRSPVLTSPTLWAGERLHPLVRYLGLRVLATRAADWDRPFGTLAATTSPGPRLHHQRMLGKRAVVATELAQLLPSMSAEDWVDLFDEVVAIADPRERDVAVIRAVGQPATVAGHVCRLIGVVPAHDRDPCLSDPAARQDLRDAARRSFTWLADMSGVADPLPFTRRAKKYGSR
jgi:hypothetical protein